MRVMVLVLALRFLEHDSYLGSPKRARVPGNVNGDEQVSTLPKMMFRCALFLCSPFAENGRC